PTRLAEAARLQGSALIHISTDYVFDGSKGAPYNEDDPVHPLSVYGKSKAAGEVGVRCALDRHIILRTSWGFSPWSGNFMLTMLDAAARGESIKVVDDQLGCPTYAPHLGGAIIAISRRLLDDEFAVGTYHFCGAPATTWFGFAQAIFEQARNFGY